MGGRPPSLPATALVDAWVGFGLPQPAAAMSRTTSTASGSVRLMDTAFLAPLVRGGRPRGAAPQHLFAAHKNRPEPDERWHRRGEPGPRCSASGALPAPDPPGDRACRSSDAATGLWNSSALLPWSFEFPDSRS